MLREISSSLYRFRSTTAPVGHNGFNRVYLDLQLPIFLLNWSIKGNLSCEIRSFGSAPRAAITSGVKFILSENVPDDSIKGVMLDILSSSAHNVLTTVCSTALLILLPTGPSRNGQGRR